MARIMRVRVRVHGMVMRRQVVWCMGVMLRIMWEGIRRRWMR